MTNANLYDRLARRFPADRARSFALLPDGGTFSYADVEAFSARYANALRAAGVAPGDRVAVQVAKGMPMVMLYLGCLRAGAIFLPLNPAYTPAELDHFLRDAEPVLFVCDPASADDLRAVAAEAGVKRHWSRSVSALEARLEWVSIAPFDRPVVPDV